MTKGEQTRKRIVAAAAPIFNQRGFEGSSLADLMKATGLQKGGIYRHFSSKQELAAAAFDHTWQAVQDVRNVHVAEAADGMEQLKQAIANFVAHRSPVPGGCPILNTAIDSDDGNPVLRDRVRKALRAWRSQLQSMVKAAAKQGQIRDGIDPKSVATVILAALEGALMISRLERNDDALQRVKTHLLRYLDEQVTVASG